MVDSGNTVEQRPITAARTQGDDTIVSQGLEVGERVVTDGQLRLRLGSKIVDKSAAPGGPPNP